MQDEIEKSATAAQITRKKALDDGNSIINEICSKLKLLTFTRSVSQIIFQKCFPFLSTVSAKKLAATCVYLSSKVTDSHVDPNEFKMVLKGPNDKVSFDVGLEQKICQLLNFSFDFLDIYLLVKDICKALHREETLEERLKTLDKIFACEKINAVSTQIDSTEAPYLGFIVFSEEEIRLYEIINCIEIDMLIYDQVKREVS